MDRNSLADVIHLNASPFSMHLQRFCDFAGSYEVLYSRQCLYISTLR